MTNVKMSGMFVALCMEEPMVLGVGTSAEEAQALIDAHLEEEAADAEADGEEPIEQEFAVLELSAGALRVLSLASHYFENCPAYNGKVYTIREFRLLNAAGEIPNDEVDDDLLMGLEHTTEVE